MVVVWRKHPRWIDYEVSNTGRVRRATPGRGTYPGRELTPYVYRNPQGYLRVLVCMGRRKSGSRGSQRRAVASLVLEAFRGFKPKWHMVARHLNDISTQNWLGNLAWGTHAENAQDAIRNGRRRVVAALAAECPF